MSINSILMDALGQIAPTEADAYQGNSAIYIIFWYSTIPVDYGDDFPSHEKHLVQVHLFAPLGENILEKRKEIKTALYDAGGTWPSYTNTSDKEGQHHVFECEFVTEVGGD